jgi:hypothetical protein
MAVMARIVTGQAGNLPDGNLVYDGVIPVGIVAARGSYDERRCGMLGYGGLNIGLFCWNRGLCLWILFVHDHCLLALVEMLVRSCKSIQVNRSFATEK